MRLELLELLSKQLVTVIDSMLLASPEEKEILLWKARKNRYSNDPTTLYFAKARQHHGYKTNSSYGSCKCNPIRDVVGDYAKA